MRETLRRHLGGGCDRSVVVMAIVMIGLMMLTTTLPMSVDGEVYLSATSGDGTQDNPYSGTLTNSEPLESGDVPSDIYIVQGTEVNVEIIDGTLYMYSIDESSGLSIYGVARLMRLVGTASGLGSFDIIDEDGGLNRIVTTIHIVEATETTELDFASDPSDGTITYVGT